jgi:hypothetical protein
VTVAVLLIGFLSPFLATPLFESGTAMGADSLELTPFSCCDGRFIVTTIDGRQAWQTQPGSMHLYFNVPSSFTVTPGSPLYVTVTYHDSGAGTLWVQYDSTRGSAIPDIYARSEVHTRSTRIGTGAFVTSCHLLEKPRLAGRQNGGADLRIALTSGLEVPLSVQRVEIRRSPPDDVRFLEALTRPWLSPYQGPTRDDADARSLEGKVMVGYQGWYRVPNDLADVGWFHWCRDGLMIPENFNVDMWPDLKCFGSDEIFAAGEVLTRSGQPARVFSSTTRETVRRHFRWMRKHAIDGAFLQRFSVEGSGGVNGQEEWVLERVREAAHREGRIWAIEYDVTWVGDDKALEVLEADWKWLVDVFGIKSDSRYAREGGRPVVAIWGLPFPHVGISKATADAVVGFFHDDPVYGGNYVLGGIPYWWRTMSEWFDHIRRYDGVLAWHPQDSAAYRADFTLLQSWGIDDFPLVWPGFSWANEMRISDDSDYVPREGGAFFWRKVHGAIGSGADRLFIGMFDEYDEGTAIMPMSDDPPDPPPEWGRFINNEGRPSDWWMSLAGEARAMLLDQRPYSAALPTEAELANLSNLGPEAWSDLGAVDRNHRLALMESDGARTRGATFAGRDCRVNAAPGNDQYFNFDVDPAFADRVAAGLDVTIVVEYGDGEGEFFLQYDGIGDPYAVHPRRITGAGTGGWRTARFEIADAYFGSREEGADFRLWLAGAAEVPIDRVRVILDDRDCNKNGSPDDCDISSGASLDCDDDWIPDECEEPGPALVCPGRIAVSCATGLGTVVEYSVEAEDCDGVSEVLLSPPSGTSFPVGTTLVHCTARDARGNESSCSFEVVVDCEGRQKPGDANQDGALDLSDAIWILGHLFLGTSAALPCEGGTASRPGPGDLALVDVNGDGAIDLSDPVRILGFLFLGSGPPALGTACVPIPGCPLRCR